MNTSLKPLLSWRHLEIFGFYACLAAILACVWHYPYLTSTDGPDHVMNAALIVDLLTGDCPKAAQYYQFNSSLVPNWLGHALMAAAIFLGANLQVAEKFIFSLCVILPAIGFRQIVSLYKKNDPRSWIAPAIGLNQMITLNGLYNFALGLGIFLIAAAYYLKHKPQRLSRRFFIVFSLLLVCAWFSHILAFLFIGALVFFGEVKALALKPVEWFRQRWALWAAFILPLALSAFYLLQPFKKYALAAEDAPQWLPRFKKLFFLENFYQVTNDDPNLMLIYGAIGLPLLLVVLKNLLFKKADPVFLCLVATGFTFWVIPFLAPPSLQGGWMMTPRFNMAGWYLVMAAAMRFTWTELGRQVFVVACIALLCGNLQAYNIKRENMEIFAAQILDGAPQLKPHSVIYNMEMRGLNLPSIQAPLLAPDAGLALLPLGNILADRSSCIVNLNNYEARHDYFPLRSKTDIVPGPVWGVPYYHPADEKYHDNFLELARFDPMTFREKTHLPLDYFIIEGSPDLLLQDTADNYPLQRHYYQENKPVFEKNLQKTSSAYRKIYQKGDPANPWIRIYEENE